MLSYNKFVRDPIYGFIGLTEKEVELLRSPAIQRLRRIKQLGNTHLVYPGACHTRFEHSLGVLHIATRMSQKLELNDEEMISVRYAALLHDIGHGPLSHNFENILEAANDKKVKHETISKKIISENEYIGSVLGPKKEEVLSILGNNETISSQIISSSLDADRLDYLLRDSYHTGVSYGLFDIERILHTINKYATGKRQYLTILHKGKDALENYRLARYLMHTQVYFHHARASADKMFERAMMIALRDGIINKDDFKLSNPMFLDNYTALDDYRMFQKLLSSNGSTPGKLINDIENRNLYKRAFAIEDINDSEPLVRRELLKYKPDDFKKLELKLAEKCGCDPDFILTDLQKIENSLYKTSYEFYIKDELPFYIESNGKIKELDLESPIQSNKTPFIRFFIFCPEAYKDSLKEITKDMNDIL